MCDGKRLREEALHVLVDGKNIVETTALSITEASTFL